MKAWDTNVLIRHLTEDDPKQLAIARAELAKAERRNEGIWLTLVIMIETAWVLTAYDLTKAQILKALEAVTQDTRFQSNTAAYSARRFNAAVRKATSPSTWPRLLRKKWVP